MCAAATPGGQHASERHQARRTKVRTRIRRADGVSYRVGGVGHMFAIPHDLAHLAIERALGLHRGFWGSVADGAVFPSMTYLSGRRRPHAAERSRAVLQANHGHLIEAEVLVRIFNDALEEGHGAGSAALRTRLRENSWTPPGESARRFTDDQVFAACAAWNRMLELWERLPVGGALEFTWPGEPPHPGGR